MEKRQHLKLPLSQGNLPRKKKGGGGGFKESGDRKKSAFSQQSQQKADHLVETYSKLKEKFTGAIDPSLIYEIELNQSVYTPSFEKVLSSMGIHVLAIADGIKGFWVVFNDQGNLDEFKRKVSVYGSDEGPNYDFFHAIDSLHSIPYERKIGQSLKAKPLGDIAEFIDIELWKRTDTNKNEKFIEQLRNKYNDSTQFQITDQLITKSFVLLRVKLTKKIFNEIIELNEIARVDRPAQQAFNPHDLKRPDINNIKFNKPNETAAGILIIDSGIVSNHPMLEKCIGDTANFQDAEEETQDTVGHGTAVAGCAAYGDIEKSLTDQEFNPENWIFSAKVMYAEKHDISNKVAAAYDPEKLVENQLKEAVEYFLSNPDSRIKVVNISLGNRNEVWYKNYSRQLPLAALIDELALSFPEVIFIVSAGNQDPRNSFTSIAEIIDNYPNYFQNDSAFNIINPATAALAFTIGSIAGPVRREQTAYAGENISTPIAVANQPSPFTRIGPGINKMIKPELVEFGGNLILSNRYGRDTEDSGGKLIVLNNTVADDILKYDVGTSYSASKVAHLSGKIANHFPSKSANFIKNMLLVGADYPFPPAKCPYDTPKKKESRHLNLSGYGLSNFDKAIHSFNNRTVLWHEGTLGLNQIKVYSLPLPEIFFGVPGKKKITVVLTFNPETRMTRGDSYLGNRMKFNLFHSYSPDELSKKYGVAQDNIEKPPKLDKNELKLSPGPNIRQTGCHQKAWKEFKREPKTLPQTPVSLVLLNFNKWMDDEAHKQDYCISVIFEHQNEINLFSEINLYNEIRAALQTRARLRRQA